MAITEKKTEDSRQFVIKEEIKQPEDYLEYLVVIPEQKERILKKIEELKQELPRDYWKEPFCTIHWIPVDGGEIRVLHFKPTNSQGVRPVIFISGWQSMVYQFEDMFKLIHKRIEMYFVETREKYTSKIKKRKANFSLSQKAKDIQNVIDYFELNNTDFALLGTCWGATIIFQGLLDGVLKAQTIAAFSPMHKLWFNKFLSKTMIPVFPSFLLGLIMKSISRLIFLGEKAKTQKNRMLKTISEAESWKWKRTVLDTRDLELFGKLSPIDEEVLVIAGTHDRVHKAYDYPRFVEEIQNGRFFFFGVDDTEREATLGLIAYELAHITMNQKIPEIFIDYEKKIE